MSMLLLSGTGHAQSLYWDVDGSTAGAGGTQPGGIWDLGSSRWNNAAGDGTSAAWDNSGLATALFAAGSNATGSYTVNLGAGSNLLLSGLTVNAGQVTLAAQTVADGLDFGTVNAALNVAASSSLTIQSSILGSGGLTKSGAGLALLSGSAVPTGAYVVQAGELQIGNGVTVNAGALTIGGAAGLNATLSLGTGTVFNLGGGVTFSNTGTPLAAVIQGGTLNLNGNRTFNLQNITGDPDLTVSSVIGDGSTSSALVKAGAGVLLLTDANTYTGATTVNAGVGALWVQGNQASISSSSGLGIAAASSVILGSANDSVAVNRLGDSSTVQLTGGATGGASLSYAGADFATAGVHQENTGPLTFAGDHRSTLTLTPGAGDEVVVKFATLTREDHALGLVRGTALGSSPGVANSTRVLFDAAPALTNGIVPWLIGDVSSTGTGTGLVTYDGTVGLRLLSSGEYSSTLTAGTHYQKSASGALPINSSLSLASWTGANSGTTTIGAAATLSIQSGAMLFSSTGMITGGTLDLAGSQEGIIHIAAGAAVTATINSSITGTHGLTFSGSGTGNKTLVLGGANTFTGDVRVYGGILQLTNAAALNNGANSLYVQNGGSVRLNGQSITVPTLSGDGNVINNHASTAVTLTVGSGTYSGALNNGSTAALSLVKTGTVTLTLQGNNSYTGTTVIEGGTVQLGNGNGNGRLSGTTAITLKSGSRLLLTNSNSTNNLNDRVNNAATISLEGATLEFSNTAVAMLDYSETLGAVSLSAGGNQITSDQAATGRVGEVIVSSLSRSTGSTLNFTGTGLGTSTRNRVDILGTAAGFIGGWATVGSEFARYVTDIDVNVAGDQGSVVAFTAADYSTSAQTDWTAALHVKPAADQVLSESRAVASANLTTGIDLNLGGNTLNIQSGGLIKQGGAVGNNGAANRSQISNGAITAGSTAGAELFIRVTGANLNLSANVVNNSAGAVHLVKSGSGVLNLTGANTYSGNTYVNAGTLTANSAGATGTGSVIVANGARIGGNGSAGSTTAGATFTLDKGAAVFAGQSGVTDAQVLTLQADAGFMLRGSVEVDIIGGGASGVLNAQAGNHDRIIFTSSAGAGLGTATLNGASLKLSTSLALTSENWAAGSAFKLFDWSGLTTNFDNLPTSGLQQGNPLDLPDLSGIGLSWDWSQLYSSGTISVIGGPPIVSIPEPSRAMLTLTGLLSLMLRRRRAAKIS